MLDRGCGAFAKMRGAEWRNVKPRDMVRNLVMGLVAAGLFLCLLNLLAAGWEWLQYGTLRRDGRPVGLYVEDARHRLHLRPGARLHGLLHKIDINSMGFRGPEIMVPKPAGTFRVWCVGGSTTFDIFASSNETTWPARLQALLRERAGTGRVEVINAGIPGENLEGSLEDFETFFPSVRPDVLVVYHGPNDIQKGLDAVFGPPPGPSGPPLLPDIALVRLISRDVAPLSLVQAQDRWVNEDVVDFLRREFTRLIDAAESRGVSVLLVTHAFRARDDARGDAARKQVGESAALYLMTPERVIDGIKALNRLVVELAGERRLALADVRSAVPPDGRYWGDALHFSDAGSELAAREIARSLERHGLLP